MSEKKFQVFISSTYEDLKEERQKIMKSILEIGDIPVGMEMFNAGDEEQWKTIIRTIDDCDYCVLIVADRYGSKKDDKSYTQMEYEYAASKGMPILRFIIDEEAPWPSNKKDSKPTDRKKLKDFKELVGKKMVSFWNDSKDLELKFIQSYVRAKSNYPRTGWMKATSAPSAEMASEISRLSAENAHMRTEIKNLNPLIGAHGLSQEELIKMLFKQKAKLRVRFDKCKDWENISTITLWEVFNQLCINMDSSSNSLFSISKSISHILTPTDKRKDRDLCKTAPIATNTMTNWLLRLEAVGLVKNILENDLPTTKWIITAEGRALYLFYLRTSMIKIKRKNQS